LVAANIGSSAFATVIGSTSIVGVTLTGSVDWNDTFTAASATGTISGVIVTAQVLPTLNMTISTGAIDLGILVGGVESAGSLDIEVGTNATNGVTITARSGSGGLTNTIDNLIQINELTTDGIGESYTFASTANAIDSTVSGFDSTGDLTALEINNNLDENIIYSTNKPEPDLSAVQDVTFTVAATSSAQTAAGNYQDSITFTITGNF
jgi:hypothetical protein